MSEYIIGYHSDELECPHVALVGGENGRDDVFDVRLYGQNDGTPDEQRDYEESLDGLRKLVDLANQALGKPCGNCGRTITDDRDVGNACDVCGAPGDERVSA